MEERNMEELQTEQTPETEVRDFDREVRDLFAARPELRGSDLPEPVVRAALQGKDLPTAYSDYARSQRRDAAALRTENRILRQNVRAASQAPVRGVTRGGGPDSAPEDPFLRGFRQEW
jgi:hypothetical protein